MPDIAVASSPIGIIELITSAGFAKSNGEARRLVKQNAVNIGDVKVTDTEAKIAVSDGQVLKVGKRRFGKIKLIDN